MTPRNKITSASAASGRPGNVGPSTLKLPYQTPRVIDYGSLTELTRSGLGTMADGVPFMATGVNP